MSLPFFEAGKVRLRGAGQATGLMNRFAEYSSDKLRATKARAPFDPVCREVHTTREQTVFRAANPKTPDGSRVHHVLMRAFATARLYPF